MGEGGEREGGGGGLEEVEEGVRKMVCVEVREGGREDASCGKDGEGRS